MAQPTLTYEADFGPKFQFHILAIMCRLPSFTLRYRSALSHEYFNDETLKVISKALLQHVDENKQIPVLATLIEDCKAHTSAQTMPYVEAMLDKIMQDDIADYEAVAKKVVEWGKTQAMCVAIVACVELIETKKRDKVISRVQQAQLVGEDLLSLGLDYAGSMTERIARYGQPEETIDTIATGIKHLDIAMGGGIGRGELCMVIAPPGKGKTTTLINFGFGALISASCYNVIHYTLEMKPEKIAKRYDDRLMGAMVKMKSQDPDEYGRMLESRADKFMKGRLIIQGYNTRQAGVSTFRAHLSMLAADGFKPDLIIVDYGDIVKPERRLGDMRHEQAGIYEDLRQLAGEQDAGCWTASQGNKASLEKEVTDIGDVAESFEKSAIVDGALGFCQSKDEKIKSEMRFLMAKWRGMEDGGIISCNIYRDRCAIVSHKYINAQHQTIADDSISPEAAEHAPNIELRTRTAEGLKKEAGITPEKPVYKGPYKKSAGGAVKRQASRPSPKVPPP